MATKKIYLDNTLISQNTSSYNDLYALPSINGTKLQGEITSDEIGLYSKEQVDNLIASSRMIKVVPFLPSTPLPNTQYYVGPGEHGGYHIYLYDKDLNRIDLGGTDQAEFEIYQEKQPTHTKPDGTIMYDIGHNEGEIDNLTLQSHSVTNAINEIDTLLQKKQDSIDNELITNSHEVVGAINELKEMADTLGHNIKTFEVPYKNVPNQRVWQPIATLRIIADNPANVTTVANAHFLISTNWKGSYAAFANPAYTAPVMIQMRAIVENGNFLAEQYQPLYAMYQNPYNTLFKYNADNGYGGHCMTVTWIDKDKFTIWYTDKCTMVNGQNQPIKVTVFDEDIPDTMELIWASGSATTSNPGASASCVNLTWTNLLFNEMVKT